MSIEWDANEARMLRYMCENDGISFMRYFFKERENITMIQSGHHHLIQEALQRVMDGEITRLIINIPPGYTKTELAVINFICRGLALNPQAKFIHASYSSDLALNNSSICKDTITSPEFQRLWPMKMRDDTKGKKRWFTKEGGGLMAVAAGGQVTGFRAGRMEKGKFSGAFIIDDPIKPDDAYSDKIRERINDRYNNTVRSRLAVEEVPIIIIMQRIHENDFSGFLLKGGSDDKWHHLNLPAEIPDDPEPYPEKYTHGIPIEHDLLPGPLWRFKQDEDDLALLRRSNPYVFSAQYMQQPSALGGNMFRDEWWEFYEALPLDASFKIMYADTAQKTGQHNDFSVLQCWAFVPKKGIFLVDQIRGKWEAPELESRTVAFWNKHKPDPKDKNRIPLRKLKVEDKVSGTGLIQSLSKNYGIPVEGISRNRDKVVRAMDCVPQVCAGNVYLPSKAPWLNDYLEEFGQFSPLMTHAHDDQCDPTFDAIADLLVNSSSMLYANV